LSVSGSRKGHHHKDSHNIITQADSLSIDVEVRFTKVKHLIVFVAEEASVSIPSAILVASDFSIRAPDLQARA
jgi:hypothetical protein